MVCIAGLQKTSLIDFEPYTSCVIFLAGCNLRCPFCHNPDIITNARCVISDEELFLFLEKRKKWLDGIVVTGGEPCQNQDLASFIVKIKESGFKVKLDTNGCYPEVLRDLLEKRLVDYVAMDIKTSPGKYDLGTKSKVDIKKVRESASMLMENGVDYEFRTTCVPGIVSKEDIESIGHWLKGAKRYFLQQFNPKICLDKEFEKIAPYTLEVLASFRDILSQYVSSVKIRS